MAHGGSQTGQKVALITDATGGIGLATGLAHVRAGFRVFGTSRRASPGEVRQGIHMLACDVTDDASVAAAIDAVLDTGAERARALATPTLAGAYAALGLQR